MDQTLRAGRLLWVSETSSDGGQGRYEAAPNPPACPYIRQDYLLARAWNSYSHHNSLLCFCPARKMTTNSIPQADLTNGHRRADPPDPMDDVLEVLMKNGGEIFLLVQFHQLFKKLLFEERTCCKDESCKLARCQHCSESDS